MAAVIQTRALGKRYRDRWALTDCTLSIPAGQVAGLVGPNGAGKTTLLHLITGLLPPTTGTIEVAGGRPAASSAQLARVGFVAQDTPVYAVMSIADHLRLGAHFNPHWDMRMALVSPVTVTTPVTVSLADDQMSSNGQIVIPVTGLPGAWIVSNETITPSGKVFVLPDVPACQTGTQQQCDAWFATQHLRGQITYQPASRFWLLQWYETALLLAAALALAASATWRIRRYRP